MRFLVEIELQPDLKKQAQEVIFSRKITKKNYPKIFFNNISLSKADSQKHMGLHLDLKLSFDINITTVLTNIKAVLN